MSWREKKRKDHPKHPKQDDANRNGNLGHKTKTAVMGMKGNSSSSEKTKT
jgi:hypothetical protein